MTPGSHRALLDVTTIDRSQNSATMTCRRQLAAPTLAQLVAVATERLIAGIVDDQEHASRGDHWTPTTSWEVHMSSFDSSPVIPLLAR